MIELVAIAAGAVLAVVGLRAATAPHLRARPPAAVAMRLPQLERAERAAEQLPTAADVHMLLRPLLRGIVAERLRARGLDLDRRPAAARRLLGEELWELVRPDRPPPDRGSTGISPQQRDALLDRLEAL